MVKEVINGYFSGYWVWECFMSVSFTEFDSLDAGILIMVQQVRLMMFSLNMVDYSMPFLLWST